MHGVMPQKTNLHQQRCGNTISWGEKHMFSGRQLQWPLYSIVEGERWTRYSPPSVGLCTPITRNERGTERSLTVDVSSSGHASLEAFLAVCYSSRAAAAWRCVSGYFGRTCRRRVFHLQRHIVLRSNVLLGNRTAVDRNDLYPWFLNG
jgi:hypothetical protein